MVEQKGALRMVFFWQDVTIPLTQYNLNIFVNPSNLILKSKKLLLKTVANACHEDILNEPTITYQGS